MEERNGGAQVQIIRDMRWKLKIFWLPEIIFDSLPVAVKPRLFIVVGLSSDEFILLLL